MIERNQQEVLVQKLYKELKQEFFQETFNFDTQQHKWKQELDVIKFENQKKEKTLQSKYQLLENMLTQDKHYYSKLSSKSKMIKSNVDKEVLEQDLIDTREHYQNFVYNMKNKQYYTQTLKLMERRLQEDIDNLNKQVNGIQSLNSKTERQCHQIKEEIDTIWKQENHYQYRQTQELIKQGKKAYHFDYILEQKKDKLNRQNDEVKILTRHYQTQESEMDKLQYIIEQQTSEIIAQDHKLEQKYQEKTESQEFIAMLDDLEHLTKVFNSENPQQYFEQDGKGNLQLMKLKSIQNMNDIWEILESSSENLNEESSQNVSDSQSNASDLLSSDNIQKNKSQNTQAENKFESQQDIMGRSRKEDSHQQKPNQNVRTNYKTIQKSNRIQLVSRLTVFYQKHNNIQPFFDNLVRVYYQMFHQGEALKNKLMNMQEEKKIIEGDLKKVQIEAEQYREKLIDQQKETQEEDEEEYYEREELEQQKIQSDNTLFESQNKEGQSITALLFNDHIQDSKTKIITKMKDSQKTIISALQTICNQFTRFHKIVSHSIHCIKESKNQIQINPGTFYTHEVFEKILGDHKQKLNKFEDYIFKEETSNQLMKLQSELQYLFPDKDFSESIQFILQWIQCDVINKYFADKRELINTIKDNRSQVKKPSDIEYLIMNLMQSLNENSQQNYLFTIKDLLSSYQDFFFTILRQNKEMKEVTSVQTLDLFIYDDLEYQKRKGQTIQQKKAKQFEEFNSPTTEDKLASLQTIDFDTQIIQKEPLPTNQSYFKKNIVKTYGRKSPLASQQQNQRISHQDKMSDHDRSLESQTLMQSTYTNNISSAQQSSQIKAIRPQQQQNFKRVQSPKSSKQQNKFQFRNRRKENDQKKKTGEVISVKYHNNNENIKEMLIEMQYIENMRNQFAQRSRSAEPLNNNRKQQEKQEEQNMMKTQQQFSQQQLQLQQPQSQNNLNTMNSTQNNITINQQSQKEENMANQSQQQSFIPPSQNVRIVKAFTKKHHEEQKLQTENLQFLVQQQENFRKTKQETRKNLEKRPFQSPQNRIKKKDINNNNIQNNNYMNGNSQQNSVQQNIQQKLQDFDDFQKYFDLGSSKQQSLFPYIKKSGGAKSPSPAAATTGGVRYSQRKQSPEALFNKTQPQNGGYRARNSQSPN